MDDNFYNQFKRITNFRGTDSGESMTSHSEQVINNRFKSSPSYRRAKVISSQYPDIKEIDIRVVSIDRLGTIRDVIFRPNEVLERGSILIFDKAYWLVYDSYANTISPKATVQQCNETISFKAKDGTLKTYYAFVGASGLGSKANQPRAELAFNKYDMKESSARNFVYVESNEHTNKLDVNSRLIIGKRAFRIVGKDDSTMTQLYSDDNNQQDFSYGLIQFSLTNELIKPHDDLETGVAQDFNEGLEEWGMD